METQASNPYKAPESEVETVSSGKLSGAIERFSAWGVFGLAIITLGIYSLYWMFSRTKQLNAHSANPISSRYIAATVILYLMNFVSGFVIESAPIIGIALSLAGMAGSIMFIVWIFKIRNRIHEIAGVSAGDSRWCNGVLTFFFSILYLQYKSNVIIDGESA